MSTDRAGVTTEAATGGHVAGFNQVSRRGSRSEASVHQIRSRITDTFQPADFPSEQDNQPPALVALYRRIARAFSATEREFDTPERSSRLTEIKNALENLRSVPRSVDQRSVLEHAKTRLLIERHQLLLKNEFTEGFGRIEAWILSIAALGLVLLDVVSLFLVLPVLALSIARSWYLDRQCKRRLKKISDIDALIERIELAS